MKVLDLDLFVPEPKDIKLGGKTFDITFIPFGIEIQLLTMIPQLNIIEANDNLPIEDAEKMIDLIYQVLKISDETLEKSWVVKRITTSRFNQIFPLIYTAIFDTGKKKEAEAVEETTS